MSIQWFPGHMNRAKNAIFEQLREIDIVIELLDCRAPFSSCNPLLQSMTKYKKVIKLLNKSDLADPNTTQAWSTYFQSKNNSVLLGNKNDKAQRLRIIKACRALMPNRNSFEKPLRVMIIGIPNVGKSTLINQLINKKSAKTGDIPAVTKAIQRLSIEDNFLVYDTPGMMWQKIAYKEIGYNLALCNSIGRNALDEETLALYLVSYLKQNYPNEFKARYKLDDDNLNLKDQELLKIVGKKRGCIVQGGVVDLQKVSEIIIQDFRDGKIGQISLESPKMWEEFFKNNLE